MPVQKFEIQPVQGNTLVDDAGHPTEAYRKWLDKIPPAVSMPAVQTPPTAANSPATASGFACDNNFLYVITPSGVWKKIPLAAL